jgi:hypothetical protein
VCPARREAAEQGEIMHTSYTTPTSKVSIHTASSHRFHSTRRFGAQYPSSLPPLHPLPSARAAVASPQLHRAHLNISTPPSHPLHTICTPSNLLSAHSSHPSHPRFLQLELWCPALNSIERIVANSVLADVVTSVLGAVSVRSKLRAGGLHIQGHLSASERLTNM